MRVIAGENRGMPLRAPKGDRTRPTTDRVKESLFAIITPYLAGTVTLDLFAGSGALSIEALSRGAAHAVLADKDPSACACIRENLTNTRLVEKAQLMQMPAVRAIELLRKQNMVFDIVFLDPPYERGLLLPSLVQLTDDGLIRPDGLVVAEHSRKEEMPSIMENLACVRQEIYGDTALSFLRYKPA